MRRRSEAERDDPVGGGTGRGNCQPIVAGPFERWGLGADDSFW